MPEKYKKEPIVRRKVPETRRKKTLYDVLLSAFGDNPEAYLPYFGGAFGKHLDKLSTLEAVTDFIEINRPLIIANLIEHAEIAYEYNYNGYKIISREDRIHQALNAVIEAAVKGVQVGAKEQTEVIGKTR